MVFMVQLVHFSWGGVGSISHCRHLGICFSAELNLTIQSCTFHLLEPRGYLLAAIITYLCHSGFIPFFIPPLPLMSFRRVQK